MNTNWSIIYNQTSYPESFEYDGLTYYLKKENRFFRTFRTSDGQVIGVSRVQDSSIEIDPQWIQENYLNLTETDKQLLKHAISWMEVAERIIIEEAIAEAIAEK